MRQMVKNIVCGLMRAQRDVDFSMLLALKCQDTIGQSVKSCWNQGREGTLIRQIVKSIVTQNHASAS